MSITITPAPNLGDEVKEALESKPEPQRDAALDRVTGFDQRKHHDPVTEDTYVPPFLKERRLPSREEDATKEGTEETSLGQLILDGGLDEGRTLLVNQVSMLRTTLAQRYVPGWFRRLLRFAFGIEDNRVVMQAIEAQTETGGKALFAMAEAFRKLQQETEAQRTQHAGLADAIESRNERDQLRKEKTALETNLEKAMILSQKTAKSWEATHNATIAKHQEDLKAVSAAHEAENAEHLAHIAALNSRVEDLEARLALIAESSALINLKEAFKAAQTAKTPRKIDTALDRLVKAQAEVDELVSFQVEPFTAVDEAEADTEEAAEEEAAA